MMASFEPRNLMSGLSVALTGSIVIRIDTLFPKIRKNKGEIIRYPDTEEVNLVG
jgi:hypothetical protein